MSTRRINIMRKRMKEENLDGLIINHMDHIRYLCGFTGTSGMLIIGRQGADFFTDSRYTAQAARQVKGAIVRRIEGVPIASLKEFPELNVKNRKYGYFGDYLTVASRDLLASVMPDSLLVGADNIVGDLGWVKEKRELEYIEQAVEISDVAFERILQLVAPGVRESELRAELEYQMAMLGSEKPAFETIVASGYRSAMPHGVASTKKLETGDFVTFDFGATVNGYVSDITRTVVVGKASARQKRVYSTVLRAQLAGIKAVKAGMKGRAVDAVCRGIIKRAGFGKNFGHGTGHGIGYYIHVGPRVAPKSEDSLRTNHVITIEPGIYIDGWGGVRIEDDVVVTPRGGKVLNKAEKKLLEL
jgi:Xaa-Pro aminopeptidase